MPGYQRAQVIAWYDYIKSELPDIFFVQNDDANLSDQLRGQPLSRARRCDGPSLRRTTSFPLGTRSLGQRPSVGDGTLTATSAPTASTTRRGPGSSARRTRPRPGSTRTWATCPQGYDGVDNNGNSLIDEMRRGGATAANLTPGPGATCTNHTHITARAEMLYAILVEGAGPLGSVFNRDDFTDREVQDTDGDGLPEFVDAWGQPLQFFRWPLLYHSDLQRGQVIVPDQRERLDLCPVRCPGPRTLDASSRSASRTRSTPTSN